MTSEVINPVADTTVEFDIVVFGKGFSQAYNAGKFKAADVERVVTTAMAFGGVGQFRNGGHGCFEVVSFTEQEIGWKDALAARLALLKAGQQIY